MLVGITIPSVLAYTILWYGKPGRIQVQETGNQISLPYPRFDSDYSLELALAKRRSIRDYSREPLKLQELSQLLWAAQGVTDPRGLRTAPSAGGLYPLEVYVVAGDIEGLPEGAYKYIPNSHALTMVLEGDRRRDLCDAALGQSWVGNAPATIVITAVYERTTIKYGERGVRYVHIEVGHAAQNLCLQATALNLGAVTVGAFYDDRVKAILNLPDNEQPLYLIPVGRLSK